jgi:hypothetical protein
MSPQPRSLTQSRSRNHLAMISSFDDYCLHQTPAYVRIPATPDRNFYDRYWFNGYSTDGAVAFGMAYGRYPNRHVHDAHLTIVVDGTQHSLHVSGAAPTDPTRTEVGPFRLEVLEPMRVLRVTIDPGEHGIEGSLTFRATTGAIDEGRLQSARRGILYVDQTRFMQYGTWEGDLTIDGVRVPLTGRCHGLRDKSWGVRPIAEQSLAGDGGSLFWMNVVMRLGDDFSIVRTVQLPDGTPHELEGYYAPTYSSPDNVPVGEEHLRPVTTWRFDLDFVHGTRRIRSGRYELDWPDGTTTAIEARTLATFWYAGMGYEHERWQQGLDHGGEVVEREDWVIADVDLSRRERQFMCHVLELRDDADRVGFGHTEQFFLGPYAPFGWDRTYVTSTETER